MTSRELRPDWLERPRSDRLDPGHPDSAACLDAHRRAVAGGSIGYLDPTSGLFVMTAPYLRDRGWCCDRGCRHCPYTSGPDERPGAGNGVTLGPESE
ncbi:MAG: DUF5522 domain-containing protein [Acidimicrobiales bacterium]